MNELERRRESIDLAKSAPVVCADGTVWYLPKPDLWMRAQFAGGRAVAAVPSFSYGSDVDDLVKALSTCTDDAALLAGAATLGAILLKAAYHLTEVELDTLLCLDPDVPASAGWPRAVMQLAIGDIRE